MDEWMKNPKIQNMDSKKLALLSALASEGVNKKQNEMLPFFLSAMNTAKNNNINFDNDEKNILLDVLMQQLSPEEKKKAETIMKMTSAFK